MFPLVLVIKECINQRNVFTRVKRPFLPQVKAIHHQITGETWSNCLESQHYYYRTYFMDFIDHLSQHFNGFESKFDAFFSELKLFIHPPLCQMDIVRGFNPCLNDTSCKLFLVLI
ncbi:protein of unknown function [Burkholderia multivorans]